MFLGAGLFPLHLQWATKRKKEILEVTDFITEPRTCQKASSLWVSEGNHQLLVTCYGLDSCVPHKFIY